MKQICTGCALITKFYALLEMSYGSVTCPYRSGSGQDRRDAPPSAFSELAPACDKYVSRKENKA